MTIQINKINNEEESIIKSKIIICPKCYESTNIKIKDYKINLYGCKNNHNIINILFGKYLDLQKIDESKIICNKCNNKKSNSYQRLFYRCNICKINICIKCKEKHDKNHKIIDYDNKYYYCEEHNDIYTSYCKDCFKNICILCEKDHINHEIISYGKIISKKEDLINKKNELRNEIDKMYKNIREIIYKLNKVIENFANYYKIVNDTINNYNISNRNYEILNNINEISNNNIINEIKEINNENNDKKIIKILDIYDKMLYCDEINIINEIKRNEDKKKIFEKDFVENNNDACKMIYKNNEYKISKEKTINIMEKNLKSKYNSFFMKIILKDRKPINVLLTNNHILNEYDIKIGSKIKIICKNKEKVIEIMDYRFTQTNKNLNYTCIQIFNSEFEDNYFKDKNYSIIKIDKNVNENLIEFNNLNRIYEDIEYKLSLGYFLNRAIGSFNERLINEFKQLSFAEKEFGLLSLMGIKLLLLFEKVGEIKGFIKAPENSPYKNGIFRFKMLIPNNYPNEPPSLFIETNIFHCNYKLEIGRLFIDYVMNWDNKKHLLGALTSLYEFFISNNPDLSYNYEAASCYWNDPMKFEEICREYTNKYANYDNIDEVRYLFEENYNRINDGCSNDYIKIVYDLRTIKIDRNTILSNIHSLESLIRDKLGIFNDFAVLVGNMAFSSLQGLKKEDFSKISSIFIIPKIRCG